MKLNGKHTFNEPKVLTIVMFGENRWNHT